MKNKTMVSIVMPNEKDLEIMNDSILTLKSLGVPYEVMILSAHRAPHQMIKYTKEARDRGIEVIIATARGAAHLPGMIASFTTLPVIAVPLKSPFLDGLDSLLSMLHMPEGVPVATMSVNGAKNAAILASQIISLHDDNIKNQLDKLKAKLEDEVEEQANRVSQNHNSEEH